MTQFCANCGKPNTDTVQSCVACGQALPMCTRVDPPKSDAALRLAQRFFEVMCGVMGDGNGYGYCDSEEHDVFIHMPRCRGCEAMSTERDASCDCRAVSLRVSGRQVLAVREV